MKGKISKIWHNKLDDGRTYDTLSIDGERYNLWNKEYLGKLKEGDMLEYEFTKKGKYKNIQKLTIQEQTEHNTPDADKEEQKTYLNPMIKKEREIARMSCIKSAIYAVGQLVDLDVDEKTDKIIDVAKKFEKYITDFSEFNK